MSADVEMLWIDAWNDLYDIVGSREDFPCVLPDYSRINPVECRGWLQRGVYNGYSVHAARGWHDGHPAVVVSRFPRPKS